MENKSETKIELQCVILTGGRVEHPEKFKTLIEASDFIIAADSGLNHLEQLLVCPNLIVGDFDSYKPHEHFNGLYEHIEIVSFPVEKDYTDTELAIHEAIQRGYKKIVLIGATGTRLDHTLANVFLLKQIHELGASGLILDDHNEVFLLKEGQNDIENRKKTNFSIVPIDRVIQVSMIGFKYPLDHASISFASTVTISNEVVSEYGTVILHSGDALGMYSID